MTGMNYSLCGACGAVTRDADWTGWNRDDDDALVPAAGNEEPGYLRCPACQYDHRDDDSDPGVWGGSLVEMEKERAGLLIDGDWWPEAWADRWAEVASTHRGSA